MLAPPASSQPLLRWAQGSLLVLCRPGTPAYKLQHKTRSRVCVHALPLQTLPLYRGWLRCCHMSCSSRPCHCPTKVGSGAAMCPMTPDHTSLLGRALVLPHVLWLQTSPPARGELRRCHVSYRFGPLLPAKLGSGAALCPTAPDPTSLLGRALVLPCVLWLRTSPVG
jgi:hypothetical protein